MKILLLATPEETTVIDKTPFMGLLYIASCLRKYDYDVSYIDAYAHSYSTKEIIRKIKRERPDIVGLFVSITNLPTVIKITRILREINVKIVLGGPEITSSYRKFTQEHKDLFDFIIYGEAEETFGELIDVLSSKKYEKLPHVKGLIHKDNGSIIVNKKRDYIKNINSLPFPAWNLISDWNVYRIKSKFRRFMTLTTSRGCQEACTFCHKEIFGHKMRFRSAENVIEEVRSLVHKYDIKEIDFVEDNFAQDYKRAIKIAKGIKNNFNIAIKCMTGVRINCIDFKLLKELKKAGCYHVFFGIESGDPYIRKRMKKRVDIEKAEKVIKWCRKLNIFTTYSTIIGFPGETNKSFRKSVKLMMKLDPDYATFNWFLPLPSTEGYEMAKKEGWFTKAYPCDSYLEPVWVPNNWDYKDFRRLPSIAFKKFYNYRKRIGLAIKILRYSSFHELRMRIIESWRLAANYSKD